MYRILTATLLLAAALPPVVSGQVPPGYWLQHITDNDYLERSPRMNSHEIVFESRSGPGGTGELFLYDTDSETLTQLTDNDVADASANISEDGTITWTSYIGPPGQYGEPTGEIMIRDPDGTVTRLTDNAVEDGGARINSLRHVAWRRYMGPGPRCGGTTMDIYFFDGQTIRPITIDGFESNVANQLVFLNDLDDLTWTRDNVCGNPGTSQIMLYSNGQTSVISVPEMYDPGAGRINNQRQVTWSYYRDHLGGGHQVVLWEDGVSLLVALGRSPTLNDRGDIAFSLWGQTWLYRDRGLSRIARRRFDVYPHDINESGEIVLLAGRHPDLNVWLVRRFDLGDLNCDRLIDVFDIEPFILALSDPSAYQARYRTCDPLLADLNEDGIVNAFDIEPFLDRLFP